MVTSCPVDQSGAHHFIQQALRAGAAVVAISASAWAIPSPDVMVNLFASSAQILGLASVVLGRWLWVRKKRGAGQGPGAGRGYRAAFLGALALCAASSIGWALYAAQVADERNERLQVNLNRNSREEGKKIIDVSLRELSYSGQLQRQDGLATEALAAQLASDAGIQLLDVRESEEFEVGAIAGARHARFPDVLADPARFLDAGRPVTLLCFNGNRSSELAETLAGLGYRTNFVVGGYEKWLAEDRPVSRSLKHERRELREIASYPGDDVLFDTRDIVELLGRRDVLFVDVRYPGDFETLGHLPGAVNIPFRKLTTPELDAALAALPRKPVVVPCYDKRSSFFASIVGLRLTRLGYEFLGRYTTPESFAVPGKEKPHVAAWKASREKKTLLSLAAAPLAGALEWVQGLTAGTLWTAILLLVLLVRLALLPLTVRAERDRRTEAALHGELSALKLRLRDDPPARSKACMALLARHGVRPFWNLASSVAQLVLFTVFFGVVSEASRGSAAEFLWVPEIGKPDPTWILPVASAVLMGLVVWLTAARRTWKRGAGAAAAGLVLLALVAGLAAGTQLYLVANLVLLHVHNAGVGLWLAWRERAPERRQARIRARHAGSAAIPLGAAHLFETTGGKARRLGQLLEAGLPVPDGFVVPASALAAGRVTPDARAQVLAAFERLGAPLVAVRSSGANEDGAARSYAGVFDSILEVPAARLIEAIEAVARSWDNERAAAYTGGARESGSIIVQAQVPAEYAGVLFTEHPAESGSFAVELVEGLGDGLVSGRVQPLAIRLGRESGRVLDGGVPPIDLAPLYALGRRVEALFGAPQDVEWAHHDGRFLLLQARDITRLARAGEDEAARREAERHRLLTIASGAGDAADAVVLAQNELSELLPRPTPLSLSLMERLWDYGGSTQLACDELGVPYESGPDAAPLLVTAFGHLYVDLREQRRRTRRAPSALAAFRLARAAEELERTWREEHRPRALAAARRDAALDFGRMALPDLVAFLRERRARFVQEDYARAEVINVAADLYLKTAVRELERRGLDPAEHLGHVPVTVVQEGQRILARAADDPAAFEQFLEHSGHRAPHDWELAEPRYEEDPGLVSELARRFHGDAGRPPSARVPLQGRVLELAVVRALRWQALKEEAKHVALRDLCCLRRAVLAIAERTGLGERIFLLRFEEVERLDDARYRAEDAPRLVAEREAERDALAGVHLPAEITAAFLEDVELRAAGALPRPVRAGALKGTRVSGTGGVIGRARVLRAPGEIDRFVDGEILVARFTDPAWMPLFSRASAIVTEVGGWLSHAAIQAREHGLPAIVGVRGALDALQDGDLIRLAPDGTVERLEERRSERRRPVSIPVIVRAARSAIDGSLANLSTHGALLHIRGERLEVGEELTIQIACGAQHAAVVVRNGVPGNYGIQVASPIREAI